MSKPQKVFTIALWLLAVLSMIGVLGLQIGLHDRPAAGAAKPAAFQSDNLSTGAAAPALSAWWDAPDFALVDQHDRAATKQQLLGHPWVADFVFTTCQSMCPRITGTMATLQDRVPPDVKLVSFSVDPTRDTPAALALYAEQYHARDGKWLFLTGPEAAALGVIRDLKVGYAPAKGEQPILHDRKFLLIDARGRVCGAYDSEDDARVKQLLADLTTLESSGGVAPDAPAENAPAAAGMINPSGMVNASGTVNP